MTEVGRSILLYVQPVPAADKSVDYCILPRELVLPKYETMNNSSWNIYVRSKKSFPLRYLEIMCQVPRGRKRRVEQTVRVFLVVKKDAIFLSEKKGGEGPQKRTSTSASSASYSLLISLLLNNMVATLHAATHSYCRVARPAMLKQ